MITESGAHFMSNRCIGMADLSTGIRIVMNQYTLRTPSHPVVTDPQDGKTQCS